MIALVLAGCGATSGTDRMSEDLVAACAAVPRSRPSGCSCCPKTAWTPTNGSSAPADHGRGFARVPVVVAELTRAEATALAAEPGVWLAADRPLQATGRPSGIGISADPDLVRRSIGADLVQSGSTGYARDGSGVVIGIVDSGISEKEKDFPKNLVIASADFAGGAALDAGIVVVAAAGNFGRSDDADVYGGILSPGTHPGVITVGAIDPRGTARRSDDVQAPFSSRGPTLFDGLGKPALVAPGVALPLVARSASALWTIKAVLELTASARSDATGLSAGAGTLNALGAVRLADALANPTAPAPATTDTLVGEASPWGLTLYWDGYVTEQRKALQTILRSAKTQTQLIEDLLDSARITTGKLRLMLQTVEVGEVVVERSGEAVSISVMDEGKGVAPEFLPYVFDAFRQAETGRSGRGLELAFRDELVALPSGTISVSSAGLGEGAAFVVSLPVGALPAEP